MYRCYLYIVICMVAMQGYYKGIIQSSSNPDQQFSYSISSLADPLIALQAGDTVSVKSNIPRTTYIIPRTMLH